MAGEDLAEAMVLQVKMELLQERPAQRGFMVFFARNALWVLIRM